MEQHEHRELSKFFKKLSLFVLPFAALTAVYFIRDPFRVLYPRDNYYLDNHVEVNRDFVTTQLYLKKHLSGSSPDSFVFGSSRSNMFSCREWMAFEGGEACLHSDASLENIYGIRQKVKLIDRTGGDIKHALVVIDHETFKSAIDHEGHLFAKHPALSGRSWVSFHLLFFTAYFEKMFFWKYLHFSLTGWHRYMKDVIDEEPFDFDPVNNDDLRILTREVQAEKEEYYQRPERKHIFFARPAEEQEAPRHIGPVEEAMLHEIRDIFDRHGTRYHIVISPLYDQLRFNREDLSKLTTLFGQDAIHDYSGVNEFTKDKYNYFETSHYKPRVARQILRQIYDIPLASSNN